MVLTGQAKHGGLKPDEQISPLASTLKQPELLCTRAWALLPVLFDIAVK